MQLSWPGPAETAALRALQAGLESLYRLEPAPEVSGFLLGEPALATLSKAHGRQEQLFVLEDDELHLGLALAPQAVSRLLEAQLHHDNLAEFCLVVEGISHFLLVVHRARQEQPTRALELELQAEVDKYVAALMLARRSPTLGSRDLRRRLYHEFLLLDGLPVEEQQRYHAANELARRYVRQLEERFVRALQLEEMLAELRRFYRMPWVHKHALITTG